MPKKYRELFSVEEDKHYNWLYAERLSPVNQKEALEMSITKWEIIAENPGIQNGGSSTCALCFYHNGCSDCLVLKVSKNTCSGTPYFDYVANKTSKNARAEVKFLKSLRKGLK